MRYTSAIRSSMKSAAALSTERLLVALPATAEAKNVAMATSMPKRSRAPNVAPATAPAHKAFSGPDGLLDHPHYTRPAVWRGMEVPEVLLSGNHAAIAAWRLEQARARTAARRPDLLERPADDTEEDA